MTLWPAGVGCRVLAALVAVLAIGATACDARGTAPPELGEATAPPVGAAVENEDDSPFRGFAIEPERPAEDFTLTAPDGEPWSLTQARGRVALLFFGYTNCPDVCPQTLAKLASARRSLGPAGPEMQIVLITTDPERDTPERMADYVRGFDAGIVGLTGSTDAIRGVARSFGASFERELPPGAATEAAGLAGVGQPSGHDGHGSPGHEEAQLPGMEPGMAGYAVAHSGTVFVVDPQGQMRVSFVGLFTPEDVAHDVRLLLDERP